MNEDRDVMLQTKMKAFNDLVGGVPRGTALALYGPQASGKTLLNLQLAYEVMKQTEEHAVLIDTEGNFHSLTQWGKRFADRYKFETPPNIVEASIERTGKDYELIMPELDGQSIINIDARSIEKILWFHGRQSDISVSKAKMEIRPVEAGWKSDIADSPIAELVNDDDVSYVSYDSVTAPGVEFGTQQQNYPARATAIGYWLFSAQSLAERYKLYMTAVTHESINSQEKYKKPMQAGGKNVGYTFKFVSYITNLRTSRTPTTLKRPKEVREIWNARHPGKAPWEEHGEMELSDKGFKSYRR